MANRNPKQQTLASFFQRGSANGNAGKPAASEANDQNGTEGSKKRKQTDQESEEANVKAEAIETSPTKQRKRLKQNRSSSITKDEDLAELEELVSEKPNEVKEEPKAKEPKKKEEIKQETPTEVKKEETKDVKPATKLNFFFAPKDKTEASASPVKVNSDKPKSDVKPKKLFSAGGSKHFTVHYDPVESASWKQGEKVPYLALASTFVEIEKHSGRLKIIEMLTNLFRSIIALTPEDLLPCVYLSINRLAPEFEGLELGIGESILMKALAEATARTLDSVKSSYDQLGDLGLVAQASRNTQKMLMTPAKLTIQSVYKKLKEIASMQGNASQNKKKDLIRSLLVACREAEAIYIIRSLQGKLRIRLAEKSVLCALAHAIVLTPPSKTLPPPILDASLAMSPLDLDKKLALANETLCSVYSELPVYDTIIKELLQDPIEALPEKCFLTPGIPVKPMLAQPTKKGISEVLDRFSNMTFTCEYKYDGERAEIHFLENGSVRVYSRNLENNTEKFPDIPPILQKAKKSDVTSFILDCEAVAWDKEQGKILPFQVLSTRARKAVQLSEIKVQVCLFVFDLLFINGKSITKEPLRKRRELLHSNFSEVTGEFTFAKYRDISDTEEIQAFLNEAVEGNCEGLMVKTLEKDATYEPSRRSYNWLKIKKDYIDGMGDSLDLVVIGAYIGRGKRTGVYGGYLLACYDDETETYQSVCKIGTGFSDEDLQKHSEFFKQHIISGPKSYYAYGEGVKPDVWFDAVQVWEILAADLSLSPVHQAAVGLVDPVRGVALRFPRFIRIRDDKKPENATTAGQVADMYRAQKINHSEKDAKEQDEDDY
eukprot:TRINITY_DN6091_c0_g1_i1.p1 TRINITY_DN6091_c0_g1~~TRINITY_DN6091_c0_g1_i1.p1  ORF type:complete len:829 (-),score=268.02 TRINITY_DN6091_c0_g1_i1:32-2518(-)